MSFLKDYNGRVHNNTVEIFVNLINIFYFKFHFELINESQIKITINPMIDHF
jgi:hypothetical protein